LAEPTNATTIAGGEANTLSNRDFDYTTAGMRATVEGGLWTAVHVATRPGLLGTPGFVCVGALGLTARQ